MNQRTRVMVASLLTAMLAAPVFPGGTALALSPGEHVRRGAEAYDAAHFDTALKEFSRGMKEHPDEYSFPLGMAMTLERMGRLAEAETYAREAVRLAPEDGVVRVRLGVILARQGKSQEAIVELTAALNLPIRNHGPALAMYELGVTYDEAGDSENALKYLEQAVEYSTPETYPYGGQERKARALAMIGTIYIERGQFQEGAAPLLQAFDLDEDLMGDQRFLLAYARLTESQGQGISLGLYTIAATMDSGSYYGRAALSHLFRIQPGAIKWTSYDPMCLVNEAGLYSLLYPASWDEPVVEGTNTTFHPGEDSPVQLAQADIHPAGSDVSMSKQASLAVSQGEFPGYRRKTTMRVEWSGRDTYCDVFEYTDSNGNRLVGTRTYYALNGVYLKLVFIFRPGRDQEGLKLTREIQSTLAAWDNKNL